MLRDMRNYLILYHFKFTVIVSSAGSIFDISKYRDTCEVSIPIFSGIAILRYFWYRTPTDTSDTYDSYDTFDISRSSPFNDVVAKAQHHCR